MYFDPVDADEGDFSGGGQVRLHFSPAIALEGSIDYRRSDFENTQTHIYPVQASLLAYLMPGKAISPFLLAGAGWYFTEVEGPGTDENQNRFGPHVGGGLQAFLNKSWSIDATYRYVWLEDIESRDNVTNLLEKDYNDSGSMITAGLNFHF
jgi:opacity protein-like surface antigen